MRECGDHTGFIESFDWFSTVDPVMPSPPGVLEEYAKEMQRRSWKYTYLR